MEGDALRAEGEFLFSFVLFRERLENRVLGRTLVVSGCWISFLMGIFTFKSATVDVWLNLNVPQSSLSPW